MASPYHLPAVVGTAVVVAAVWLAHWFERRWSGGQRLGAAAYRRRQIVNTFTWVGAAVALIILWGRLFTQKGSFFGLVAAGVAVALKEPLLAIAGRLAILTGKMYRIADRIELQKMKGDVVDIGFFYTRMMEIGAWIGGDQHTGRVAQFSNALVFSTPVFNYTRYFPYIWDELQLPVTYHSNLPAAADILAATGEKYSGKFLQGAEREFAAMQRQFLVPEVEFKPAVYLRVTSNWVQLTLRYLVAPRERRAARTYIYREIFQAVAGRDDITIASTTMDVTVREPPAPAASEE